MCFTELRAKNEDIIRVLAADTLDNDSTTEITDYRWILEENGPIFYRREELCPDDPRCDANNNPLSEPLSDYFYDSGSGTYKEYMHIYLRTPSKIGQVIVSVNYELFNDFYTLGHDDGIDSVKVWDLDLQTHADCNLVTLLGADCDSAS